MKDAESQDAVEELAKSVAEQLDAGIPKQEIINRLSQAGLDPLEAQQLVEYVDGMQYEAKRQAGTKDLIWGVILILVGAAITWGTWAAAEAGGSYWVMWGLIAYGMFRIIRGLYRKVTSTTDAATRLRWVLGGIVLVGGIVWGGVAITNMVTSPGLTPPSESFVVFEDYSKWEDEIRGIVSVSGVISNTHSEWSIKKVRVEVEATDDAANLVGTYEVRVTPSTIPPGGQGVYSEALLVPYSCVYVTPVVYWEWAPP